MADLRAQQDLEYAIALQQDIRREAEEAREAERRRCEAAEREAAEREAREIALQLEEDLRAHLTPRSLRKQRLAYFDVERETARCTATVRCTAITRKGVQCRRRVRVDERAAALCAAHRRPHDQVAAKKNG